MASNHSLIVSLNEWLATEPPLYSRKWLEEKDITFRVYVRYTLVPVTGFGNTLRALTIANVEYIKHPNAKEIPRSLAKKVAALAAYAITLEQFEAVYFETPDTGLWTELLSIGCEIDMEHSDKHGNNKHFVLVKNKLENRRSQTAQVSVGYRYCQPY